MSLSKRFYEEGNCESNPILEIKYDKKQRFVIKDSNNNSENGIWEIIGESNLEYVYYCNRVLKDGSLSISDSRRNFRTFSSNQIYEALNNK